MILMGGCCSEKEYIIPQANLSPLYDVEISIFREDVKGPARTFYIYQVPGGFFETWKQFSYYVCGKMGWPDDYVLPFRGANDQDITTEISELTDKAGIRYQFLTTAQFPDLKIFLDKKRIPFRHSEILGAPSQEYMIIMKSQTGE